MPTSLFGGQGFEVITAMDVTGDGRSDLVGAHPNGNMFVWPGTAAGSFATAVPNFNGSYHSGRFGAEGHEALSEKPILRRRGCSATGCF